MPGTGTNDSRRNRISAPTVNHSRFLSSVALLKLASVMLETSCSAADAIGVGIPLDCAAHISRSFVIASGLKNEPSPSAAAPLPLPHAREGWGKDLPSAGLCGSLPRALFRGGKLGRVLALDQLDRTTGLLHRLARAFRHAGHLERQLGLELSLPEQADAVLPAMGEAGGLERAMVECALDVELAGVDRLLDRADVHLGIVAREDVVEAALRQPHVERHLAALEAVEADARARLGALL